MDEIKSVKYSKKFLKHIERLPAKIIKRAFEKERIFKLNPFDSSLNTHKLHGQDKDAWSFYISDVYRIKFIFIDAESVLFLDVGTHKVYI